jgi:hypothetical protein
MTPSRAVLLLGLVAGCGAPPDLDPSTTASRSQGLYYTPEHAWGARDVQVCWSDLQADEVEASQWIEDAYRGQRSWIHDGNIVLTGWGPCGNPITGIQLTAGNNMATIRYSDTYTEVSLDFVHPEANYTRCLDNGLNRRECIQASGLHELGHALGYHHEHIREDTPPSCDEEPGGPLPGPEAETFGPWDDRSLMGYCDPVTELSPTDRRGTNRIYGAPSADGPQLADYNADGRADLLCHDHRTGVVAVDLSGVTGRYEGVNTINLASWCASTVHRRLFTGDFDGDGRDDLLCFDLSSGTRYVDYASGGGNFGGTDWSSASAWCTATDTRQLLVGDFDGNGRDDLLCFDPASGALFIDRALGNAPFTGTDWSFAAGWCTGSDQRVSVGDFNGDGRTDLYCHDFGTGQQWVDLASLSGTFAGADWTRAGGWCNGSDTRTIVVGDFNGDGRDDLLCHDADLGSQHIDFADALGQFAGSNWSANSTWCTSNGSRLFVGDANGDNRDDLICHNVSSGLKYIDYASASGTFGGTEWTSVSSWCGAASAMVH